MGGVLSPSLNVIACKLRQWCESQNLFVLASYILSTENWETDRESHCSNPDAKLALSSQFFQKLVSQFGYPEVDLFATRVNHKCSRYFS